MRALAGLLLVPLMACSAPSPPAPAPSAEDLSPTAASLVELTNEERSRAGLGALRVSERLMHAAELHAEQIASTGRLEHTLPQARYPALEDRLSAAGYRWTAAGENLAFGHRTAAEVVNLWMQSTAHRDNVLNATFTELGVGHVTDSNGQPYYVQVFARPGS